MTYLDWILANIDWLSILIIIAVFTIITIRYYTKFDTFEKEPKWRLIIAFVFGILAGIPALILELIAGSIAPNLSQTVIVAPPIEEFSKAIFVLLLARSDEFDGPLDGLIYGGLVGAGFAFIENILYGFSALNSSGVISGVFTASFRSVFEVIGHPLFTGLFGYGVAMVKIGVSRSKLLKQIKPILFHGFWNFTAGIGGYSFLGLIILGFLYFLYLKRQFSHALSLDEKAFNMGYYNKNQGLSYPTS